jgi:hypothetical protein
MRQLAALMLGLGLACGASAAPERASQAEVPPPVAEAAPGQRPRPGERVRQRELDGYCTERHREAAFYYHGGSPVVRVAREHGCAPLYLSECEAEGRCYTPRDQEPGMWCCTAADKPGAVHAHAAR